MQKNNEKYVNVDSETFDFIKDEHLYSNPEAQIVHTDETERLKSAIEQLSLNEMQVITMKYYNNLKLDAIAAAMGISKSSVKRYLLNAEANLLKILKG